MYIYGYIYVYIIYINIFVLLLVTPNILKEHHLLGIFPQRSYRKELVYVLMRNFLFALQQKSKPTKASLKNCVYLWLLLACKFGLHPEKLPSLAYIIKLLNITIKMKTGFLMCAYFGCIYVYLYVLCSYKLVF